MVAPRDLDTFCELEWPRLVGALSLYTGDRYLAEELAQDAIARACQHWRRVRTLDAPGAWLHRVAVNLAHSHFRRSRAADRARIRHGVADDRGHETEDAVAVRLAVAALPSEERSAIVLRFYLGYSVRETAAILRCPEGTVKTRTRRGIGRLRASGFVDDEETEAEEVFDG